MGKDLICPYCNARMGISNGEKIQNCEYCGAELDISVKKSANSMTEKSYDEISYKKKPENEISCKQKLKKWKREAAMVAALEAISFFVSIMTINSGGEDGEMSRGKSGLSAFTLFFAVAIALIAPAFLGRKRPAEYGNHHAKDVIGLYVLYIAVLFLAFLAGAVISAG